MNALIMLASLDLAEARTRYAGLCRAAGRRSVVTALVDWLASGSGDRFLDLAAAAGVRIEALFGAHECVTTLVRRTVQRCLDHDGGAVDPDAVSAAVCAALAPLLPKMQAEWLSRPRPMAMTWFFRVTDDADLSAARSAYRAFVPGPRGTSVVSWVTDVLAAGMLGLEGLGLLPPADARVVKLPCRVTLPDRARLPSAANFCAFELLERNREPFTDHNDPEEVAFIEPPRDLGQVIGRPTFLDALLRVFGIACGQPNGWLPDYPPPADPPLPASDDVLVLLGGDALFDPRIRGRVTVYGLLALTAGAAAEDPELGRAVAEIRASLHTASPEALAAAWRRAVGEMFASRTATVLAHLAGKEDPDSAFHALTRAWLDKAIRADRPRSRHRGLPRPVGGTHFALRPDDSLYDIALIGTLWAHAHHRRRLGTWMLDQWVATASLLTLATGQSLIDALQPRIGRAQNPEAFQTAVSVEGRWPWSVVELEAATELPPEDGAGSWGKPRAWFAARTERVPGPWTAGTELAPQEANRLRALRRMIEGGEA